jgi:hypothetical protein
LRRDPGEVQKKKDNGWKTAREFKLMRESHENNECLSNKERIEGDQECKYKISSS